MLHRTHLNCGEWRHIILQPLNLYEVLWAQYVHTRRDGLCNLQATMAMSLLHTARRLPQR